MKMSPNVMSPQEEYISIYNKIEELEKRREELALVLMDLIDDTGVPIEGPFGVLSMHSRTTYEYSDNLKKMTEQIKKLKKEEEVGGLATIKSVTRHIRFVKPGVRAPRIG